MQNLNYSFIFCTFLIVYFILMDIKLYINVQKLNTTQENSFLVKEIMSNHFNQYIHTFIYKLLFYPLVLNFSWMTSNFISFMAILSALIGSILIASDNLTKYGVLLFEFSNFLNSFIQKRLPNQIDQLNLVNFIIISSSLFIIISIYIKYRLSSKLTRSMKIKLFSFTLRLVISKYLWQYYSQNLSNFFQVLDLKKLNELKSMKSFFILWLWRFGNASTLLEHISIVLYFNLLWKYIFRTDLIGWIYLFNLTMLSQLYLFYLINYF
ncbi:unnamed protein product [Brachionus calyciflorus]|uniref:Uncharacterized protein n=1 Tax=Brachionus calyciflorus TaxID=104777 RepID=A0A814C5H5_9BILA|nr:unnamed protein product [Brachionus calyciflorus]